jgi:hypothetical protein
MEVGQRPVPLVEIEAVAHVELVRDHEADVAHGKVVDEPAVGAVEERDRRKRARVAQRQGLAEEAQRQPGIDDVLDDQDVPALDLDVEILQQPDPGGAAGLGVGAVAGELDEVDGVGDRERAREIGEERDRRLEGADEQRLSALVVAGDVASELAYPRGDLRRREVDLADPLVGLYEAIGSLNRSASRAMSRL